nr:Ty1-copia retrotransposon protein [Tanacetum cinerariifolium]
MDSGTSRHLCNNKRLFHEFEEVTDGGHVYMASDGIARVIGKGKVFIKFTFGKTLALNNVLYVPSLRRNMVSGSLLVRAGLKVTLEGDKIRAFKYCIYPKLKTMNLIDDVDAKDFSKCLICVEAKHAKNPLNVAYKNETEEMFLKFKAKAENQLDRRIKRLRKPNIGPKTFDRVFIDYAIDSVAYRFMCLDDNSICESRDAEFFENFPKGCKSIKSKWIFKRKMRPDNTIKKFKARIYVEGLLLLVKDLLLLVKMLDDAAGRKLRLLEESVVADEKMKELH